MNQFLLAHARRRRFAGFALQRSAARRRGVGHRRHLIHLIFRLISGRANACDAEAELVRVARAIQGFLNRNQT